MMLQADGKKISMEMARNCMDLQELVEKSGVKRTTIQRVITERNTRPDTLGRIARALGVDVSELIKADDRDAE